METELHPQIRKSLEQLLANTNETARFIYNLYGDAFVYKLENGVTIVISLLYSSPIKISPHNELFAIEYKGISGKRALKGYYLLGITNKRSDFVSDLNLEFYFRNPLGDDVPLTILNGIAEEISKYTEFRYYAPGTLRTDSFFVDSSGTLRDKSFLVDM